MRRQAPGATNASWLPFGLIALVVIPGAGGVARLVELSGGPTTLPAKPHVTESPLPLILHIIAALTFAVLGAFQFSPRLRSRRPGWHRLSGRLVVVLGFVVALTALWLNEITPRPTAAAQLLYLFRLAAGSGMAIGIILGVTTIRRGDIAGHRAWMIRAYALAFGAATHVFTIGIGQAIFGDSRTHQRPHAGCRMAHQPGDRRTSHPPPSTPLGSSTCAGCDLMSRSPTPRGPVGYIVRIAGHLDAHWSAWFGDFILTREPDGTTTLRGIVADQAELHGLLVKVRDLGVTLLSVEITEAPDA